MAIINANYCTSPIEESINFSGQSIPVGSFITAVDGTPFPNNVNYCFEITAGNEPTSIFTATSETYSSCYDCLAQNYTIVSIVDCLTNTISLVLDITEFGYIPIAGTVFNLIVDVPNGRNLGIYSGCYEIVEILQYSESGYNDLAVDFGIIQQIVYSNFSLENGCNECLYGFSSGTESTICEICCPCTTDETVTEVVVPHPNYSNEQNQSIIQLNAITIGGFNGLNN
jgi:hypothetical protein